jgi:hypothetical protein
VITYCLLFERAILYGALAEVPFAYLGVWHLFAPLKSLTWLFGRLAGIFFVSCRFLLSRVSSPQLFLRAPLG